MALSRKAKELLLPQKSGVVTSRGKGGGCDLRGVYVGPVNLSFFIPCGSYSYMGVHFIAIK